MDSSQHLAGQYKGKGPCGHVALCNVELVALGPLYQAQGDCLACGHDAFTAVILSTLVLLLVLMTFPSSCSLQLQACAKGGQNGTDTGSLLGSKGFSSSLSALKKAGMRWARPLLK
jgi:hypothetical protein